MGRFKALICGASNLRRYQKIENNEENTTTKDYYCYKCAECGHRGKAKPEELTLMVENVLQDSTTTTTSLTSHDSSIRPKLNNSKNMEPSAHQSRGGAELLNFKNNCLKMVNNNLAKCNQRIPAPIQPVLDDDECCQEPPEQEMNLQIQALGLELEHDNQQLMTSPWYQQGLSRDITTEILSNRPIGAFVVRQSQSRSDALALSVHIPYGMVAHYLIQKLIHNNKLYYKIQDSKKMFQSLVSLVIHHSVMPECLPCPLILSHSDIGSDDENHVNKQLSTSCQWHHNHSNREHDFADTDLADYSNLVMTLRKSISSSTSDISSLTSVPED